jgi:hypothetical protein
MNAQDALPPLFMALKDAVPMQMRAGPADGTYLEGVLARPDLSRCYDILTQHLGPPAKDFGKPVAFAKELQRLVNGLGGIRGDQCLFLKSLENNETVYAALWPWASDPRRITLKIGLAQ